MYMKKLFSTRPAVPLAIMCSFTAVAMYCFGIIASAIIAVVFSAVIVFSGVYKKYTLIIIALICAFIALLSVGDYIFVKIPINKYCEKKVSLCGTVCRPIEYYDGCVLYTLDCITVDNTKIPMLSKIKISDYNGCGINQGDTLNLSVKLKAAGSNKEYLSDGIVALGECKKIINADKGHNIYSFSSSVRNYVEKVFSEYLPNEQQSVLCALVTGNKDNLDSALYNDVNISGVSHMLVVSGMHLSVVCSFLLSLFRKIFSRKTASAVTLPIIIMFMIICNFGYSIMRAGLVYIIMLIADIVGKKKDSLSSLCVAVTVILMINPYSVGDVSFLLSVGATFGLLISSPVMVSNVTNRIKTDGVKRISSVIITPICQCVSASVFTMPVVLIKFGYFSTVSVLTNMLSSYSVTVALCLSFCALILYLFKMTAVIKIVLSIASLLIKYFCFIVRMCAGLPASAIPVPFRECIVLAALVFILIITVTAVKKSKLKKSAAIALVAVTVTVFCFVSAGIYSFDQRISFIKVNKSYCAVVQTKDTAVLIGAPKNKTEESYVMRSLKVLGVSRIDALIVPNGQVARIDRLADKISVMKIYGADNSIIPYALISEDLPNDTLKINGLNIDFLRSKSCVLSTGELTVFFAADEINPSDKAAARKSDITVCKADFVDVLSGACKYITYSSDQSKTAGETYKIGSKLLSVYVKKDCITVS